MKKHNPETAWFKKIIGVALVVVSLVILLMNIRVTSFGFFRFGGRVNSAPILLVILIALIIWAVISGSKVPLILAGVDILLIIVSVLVGSVFTFTNMDAFTLIMILATSAVGVALYLVGVFQGGKREKKS